MVEELRRDLFCIKVPLPGSPLKYLNSYVVRTPDRNLIIDTGFNHQICFKAMKDGLNKLGIDLKSTDIFVTHFHADHFSLVPKLITPTTNIYFNRPEAELLENWQGFDEMLENAYHHGFPKKNLKTVLEAHPGSKFGVDWAPEANILSQGRELVYGDYTFTCIETPGHTLGHICLYEEARQIFVSGDHVLIDITPNIQCWSNHDNPLKSYMESLEKICNIETDIVLPGHRRRFSDLGSRAQELIAHHEDRLNEIRNILDQGPKTAYETAGKIAWDIKAPSWEDFPIAQKWFATGEALSHLRFLEERGEMGRKFNGNHVLFELALI